MHFHQMQKVELASTLCYMKICCTEALVVARAKRISTCNATLLHDKFPENVACYYSALTGVFFRVLRESDKLTGFIFNEW